MKKKLKGLIILFRHQGGKKNEAANILDTMIKRRILFFDGQKKEEYIRIKAYEERTKTPDHVY